MINIVIAVSVAIGMAAAVGSLYLLDRIEAWHATRGRVRMRIAPGGYKNKGL